MFSVDLRDRAEGDISIGRRSMMPKPSNATSTNGEVIDLVSDTEDEVVHKKDRDINDNTGCAKGGIEKRASLFERRCYQSPARSIATSTTDSPASEGRLSVYRRKSIHMSPERAPMMWPTATFRSPASQGESSTSSPRTSSASGIIVNRSYNKTPTTPSTSSSERLKLDSVRLRVPVIRLEDIRDRFSLSDNGLLSEDSLQNDRAGPSMITTGRTFTPRPNFLRRSFHKLPTSPSKILTIDLEPDSSPSKITSTFSDCEECDIVLDTTCTKRDEVLKTSTTIDLIEQQPTEEQMDVVDVDKTVPDTDSVENLSSSSSSSNMKVVYVGKLDATQKIPAVASLPDETSDAKKDNASDEVSSMDNSYGDVSSFGCLKHTSNFSSVGRRQNVRIGADEQKPLNEFDLLLLKINQTMPPMSQQDRIDQWRVTADDLLHSIPTKAAIETTSSTCAKRPLHDTVRISSDDDSDNLEADAGPCEKGVRKKRRTIEEGAATEAQGDGASCLDFRKSQINPEIDKPPRALEALDGTSMILLRKNYHKLPTRCRELTDWSVPSDHRESSDSGLSLAGAEMPGVKPYAHLLNRSNDERDKFLNYLKISPYFRTDEKALVCPSRTFGDHASDAIDNKQLDVSAHSNSNRLKPFRANRTKKSGKEKRKKPPKNKAHPSVIASTGLRGARRLVLASSLRNGKVIRYRNNILSTLAKPKPRTASTSHGRKVDGSEQTPMQGKEKKPHLATTVRSMSVSDDILLKCDERQRRMLRRSASAAIPSIPSSDVDNKSGKGRCSVDSAVSSSTSAEMRQPNHVGTQSKECQTVDVMIGRKESLLPPAAVNEGKRLRNPLVRTDGEILHVFLIDELLIAVQKERISFWKYSRLSVLLGVKQDWQRVGQIQRLTRDTEVDPHNANRIVYNHSDPVYLEPRARDLADDKSRACPLASIYVNAYFLDMPGTIPTKVYVNVDAGTGADSTEPDEVECAEGIEELVRMKSYQLDTVKSALEDIRLVPLPKTRDFIVCWHEHATDMESRTGLCKYSLTQDLDSLGCIREFVGVKQRLTSLRCMNDRKLLGLGQSTVHIWCFESGYLLRTVDLKIPIGLVMGAYLHIEANESTLIMLQLQHAPEPAGNHRKLVKVVAVNLAKPSWYIAHGYEIALASMSIISSSPVSNLDEDNCTPRLCVTFDSGELLLVSLTDPSACWTNHQRLEKELQRVDPGAMNICNRLRSNGSNELYRPRERILNGSNWNGGRDLVFLSDQQLTTKTIDEYIMERTKDRG
ncbi:uncharacterized protein LOC131293220 [Anopheles ziemanni]|uniref:uncharacterized protein LOC131267718 n=1 Tax=Anopheles coustani TaxID=139045 RepID=UPI00265B2A9D|nr:uncharacterized protein LOC131267718 [Anopheles coustani]XP_058177282.1 uncharacterized protein LOC131293220 [Anopheles ziemanni]